MIHRIHNAALAATLIALAQCIATPLASAQSAGQGPTINANPAPNSEQIRVLIARAIQNQHRDDLALQEFERVEHRVGHTGENGEVATDLVERILPSQADSIKIKLSEKGVPVSPELYRAQLVFAFNQFTLAMNPNDHYREDLAKFAKRRHDRSELVDSAQNAFRLTWAGRETRNDASGSHTYLKFLLDPNPNYQPINRFATSFQHVHAKLWMDEDQAQFARLEGDVATDIPFAGGIAGKVYRGGHVTLQQEEVAPGIWLPTLYTYDVDGRKFVFAFGVHERTEITHYRRIGPPAEALQIVRNELNNLKTVAAAK